jgi:hypothetical protein
MEALLLFLMRVVIAPSALAGITVVGLDMFQVSEPTLPLFGVWWAIWLVLVNGGILLLDDWPT